MAIDLQLPKQSITASGSSGTTAPAMNTYETWSVQALAALIPGLVNGATYSLVDATPGASISQVAEIIRVMSAASSGVTSIQVIRGADDTVPVAHSSGAVYNVVGVPSYFNQPRELAYSENVTGTASAVSGALVYTDLGVGIEIAPTPYPVMLMWDGAIQITSSSAGGGACYLVVRETTTGTPNTVASSMKSAVSGTGQSGTYSSVLGNAPGAVELGPITTWRTFELYAANLLDSGSTMTSAVSNLSTNPTWLKAVY